MRLCSHRANLVVSYTVHCNGVDTKSFGYNNETTVLIITHGCVSCGLDPGVV